VGAAVGVGLLTNGSLTYGGQIESDAEVTFLQRWSSSMLVSGSRRMEHRVTKHAGSKNLLRRSLPGLHSFLRRRGTNLELIHLTV
jgi:hypothetical protein